jgi:hypothetical protein
MIEIKDFKQVFNLSPDHGYSEHLHSEIIKNRRILDNKLFFDRLAEVLRVKSKVSIEYNFSEGCN